MNSGDIREPGRKKSPAMATASATPPTSFAQSMRNARYGDTESGYDSPRNGHIKPENSGKGIAISSQSVFVKTEGADNYERALPASAVTKISGAGSDASNPSGGSGSRSGGSDASSKSSRSSDQSTSSSTSSGSIPDKVAETIRNTLNRSAANPAQGDEESRDLPKSLTESTIKGENHAFDEGPETLYNEPMAIIRKYISKNCNKVENYWLGTGEYSFITVFSALMKSFHETGFYSLKQLSMHRARAPEFFDELSSFLMQMGLEYVNQMNAQGDITPQNAYAAAYIVACAMECMNETQRRNYIYQLRRDSNNKLRQRRGFNTKRVEFNKLSQNNLHGISDPGFFQLHFKDKVGNLRG